MARRYFPYEIVFEELFEYFVINVHDKSEFKRRVQEDFTCSFDEDMKLTSKRFAKDPDPEAVMLMIKRAILSSYFDKYSHSVPITVKEPIPEGALMKVMKFTIDDWENKKISLKQDLLEAKSLTVDTGQMNTNFFSKRDFKMKKYITTFMEIMDPTFHRYEKTVCNGLPAIIESVWHQSTFKEQNHGLHNHGYHGFSGVLYVDFDKTVHEPTNFVFPYWDPLTGEQKVYVPDVDEGDVLIFPATLSHFQPPSHHDKQRLIISFNGCGIEEAFKHRITGNDGKVRDDGNDEVGEFRNVGMSKK